MKNKIIIFVLFLSLTSCKKEVLPNKLAATDWIIGEWENNSKEGKLIENWNKVNDSVFEGVAYFVKGKDTLHNESIILKQKGANVFYLSTIKGQNNNTSVVFKLKISSLKKLIFENLKNDFPQKIIYNKTTKDSLVIEAIGIQKGITFSEKYKMSRK